MKTVATIKTYFPTKFGIPRQSNLDTGLKGTIIFENEFKNPDAIKGIEEFSHLWLVWLFSENNKSRNLTVRPPRLGGNERRGVFATRSPFRPNPIGLSSVKLVDVIYDSPEGPMLIVEGADMVSGTPIIDIKPYIPFSDSHPNARYGFSQQNEGYRLSVNFPPRLLSVIDDELKAPLTEVLSQDPRPSYIDEPNRVYGMPFHIWDIRFTVMGSELTVVDIVPYKT